MVDLMLISACLDADHGLACLVHNGKGQKPWSNAKRWPLYSMAGG